jgi:glutamyl-tRNA synthetase
MNSEIINKIFPQSLKTPQELESLYPKRDLPKDAMVTRIGPSPTGFMHLGGIYMGLICSRFSDQTDGIYFLRIEDTDKKREVDGAQKIIIDALNDYGLTPDEGPGKGDYGPYIQSERKDIYASYIKYLLEKGDAYVCFSTEDEIKKAVEEQESLNLKRGYYGKWATWRDASFEKVMLELEKGTPYIIRLKSKGDSNKTFIHHDLLKGDVSLPENDLDTVLLRGDGLPAYHFAHAVDDHLMRTTHVLRGDEWLSSVPVHYELFKILGFDLPLYGHISPINKLDNGNKRKLSKRKDPEANILFFKEKGFPVNAVIEYLLNLANSDFEDWRKENPDRDYKEFTLTMKRLANSNGPLFNEVKLRDIAKEKNSRLNNQQIFENVLNWAKDYNKYFYDLLNSQKDYWLKIFNIERTGENVRKDIAIWSEVYELYDFFDNDKFVKPDFKNLKTIFSEDEIKEILTEYSSVYNQNDDKQTWLNNLKSMCSRFGLALDIKTYKADKEAFKGHVGELTQVIRFAVTGKTQSPDLYEVMGVLGVEVVGGRLNN